MIFTDYFKAKKLTDAKYRFDIVESTGDYDFFENLLINKKVFNVGGLSFNMVKRPDNWEGKKDGYILSKGSFNITTVERPNIDSVFSIGDIQGTNDAIIIVFNPDFRYIGVNAIELFIARGYKNDKNALWNLVSDGEYKHEFEELRAKAVTRFVTNQKTS